MYSSIDFIFYAARVLGDTCTVTSSDFYVKENSV